jgi:glucose-6-phosphate dehydrogenase assembly protein OpcA
MSAAAVRPDKLLRDLDDLWRGLGNEEQGGVLRACAMTLIVCAEGAEDDLGETLALLMRDHPARAIVLREQKGDGPHLEAGVRAQCWMPFGRRQQICCELIEIAMTRASLADVPPVVHSLTAPDLPVAIWCRSSSLVGLAEFEPVLRLANKLILDSAAAADLRAQLRYMHAAEDADSVVADLSWTRLTLWRETIAKQFDNPAMQARTLHGATVGYVGQYVPMWAYYVAGWLRNSAGKGLAVEFQRGSEFVELCGDGWAVKVDPATLPKRGDYELLREELSILGRDPVYTAARASAAEMIG